MDYLKPQRFRLILRNSLKIYFRYWPTVVVIAAPVLLSVKMFKLYIDDGTIARTLIGAALDVTASSIMALPLTVAVSDICIGLRPQVQRSYQRAFRDPGRVLSTYLLYVLLSFFATLLIIPIFGFLPLYMFVCPVVVVEGLVGRAAFNRSKELGKGYYLRNLGVLVTMILIVTILGGVLGGITGLILAVMKFDLLAVKRVSELLAALLSPLGAVPQILLYYDMRSRKEDYGAPQLMEDLKY
jgi:hypothetical protein